MVIRKPSLVELSVLALLLQPWSALAQTAPDWNWPGPWSMWAGAWGLWWIFPFLMCGFMVILCVFFMFRGPWSRGGRHRDTTASALTLLSERFAKGDISKEEFEEKKAILVCRP